MKKYEYENILEIRIEREYKIEEYEKELLNWLNTKNTTSDTNVKDNSYTTSDTNTKYNTYTTIDTTDANTYTKNTIDTYDTLVRILEINRLLNGERKALEEDKEINEYLKSFNNYFKEINEMFKTTYKCKASFQVFVEFTKINKFISNEGIRREEELKERLNEFYSQFFPAFNKDNYDSNTFNIDNNKDRDDNTYDSNNKDNSNTFNIDNTFNIKKYSFDYSFITSFNDIILKLKSKIKFD